MAARWPCPNDARREAAARLRLCCLKAAHPSAATQKKAKFSAAFGYDL